MISIISPERMEPKAGLSHVSELTVLAQTVKKKKANTTKTAPRTHDGFSEPILFIIVRTCLVDGTSPEMPKHSGLSKEQPEKWGEA